MNRPRSVFGSVRSLVIFAVLFGAAATATLWAQSDDGGRPGERRAAYAIGLWGDLPYSPTAGDRRRAEPDRRHERAEAGVHGARRRPQGGRGARCDDDDLYADALGYFNALEAPAMFTPGDNDWTDCDRPTDGGFNSLERLDYERRLFFSTPFSLGQHRMRQEVQTAPLCLGVSGPVAVRREPPLDDRRRHVRDAERPGLVQQPLRHGARSRPSSRRATPPTSPGCRRPSTQANGASDSAAVMLISQANPGWDRSRSRRARRCATRGRSSQTDGQPDGFDDSSPRCATEVIAFRKPVAYVHGDSHYFRIDKPFLDAPGRRLENFTRVETFGDNQANGNNDVHWVKVARRRPHSREVFAFQPQIVPGNRTAVPQP